MARWRTRPASSDPQAADVPCFGPLVTADGVRFRLWAPAAHRVELRLDGVLHAMEARDGWYDVLITGAGAGGRYNFRIDGEYEVPDPASHFQPDDITGPSEVIDHAFAWRAAAWKGRPWTDCVFLEAHVGTFTPQRTFRAMIDKLDHLVATGITALELMPVADFPGRWNWGYDGVLPFAPDSRYGRPEDLKALVDAAHQRGLMMFLDVVYNHFGPEGNFLPRYAPAFFAAEETPWGRAIDYRVPQVRAFAIDNTLHWLRDYRFDGLRLDAVHAIAAASAPDMLATLSVKVGEVARAQDRAIHLVLENDDNRASLLRPFGPAGGGTYRAQWNDDFHHAWHVLLTGETSGYYGDYTDAGAAIARALAEGFVFQGAPSLYRGGKPRGEPSAQLPPAAFVNFLQNHDQIGNRPHGDRLTTLTSSAALECALTVLLLAPAPPLLFMGEEWGADEPFPFFCDFSGDLREAVRKGREKEFAQIYAQRIGDIPDPLAAATVRAATLDWTQRDQDKHRRRLDLVTRLLAARRSHIVPLMEEIITGAARADFKSGLLHAAWPGRRRTLNIVANLSHHGLAAPRHPAVMSIWGGDMPLSLPPWSAYVFLGDAE